jgi:hypothetical protein
MKKFLVAAAALAALALLAVPMPSKADMVLCRSPDAPEAMILHTGVNFRDGGWLQVGDQEPLPLHYKGQSAGLEVFVAQIATMFYGFALGPDTELFMSGPPPYHGDMPLHAMNCEAVK